MKKARPQTTPSPLALATAESLAAMLPDWAGAENSLPPSRALSRNLNVSPAILASALRILAGRNLIKLHPRKRARILGQPAPALPVSGSARLFADLEGRIASGDIPIGSALPKVQYLVDTMHVNNHTVLAAYRRLVEKGWAHRQGKKYLAGPPPPSFTRLPVRSFILVLEGQSSHWQGLCRINPAGRFGQSFLGEAEKYGLSIFPFATRSSSGSLPARKTIRDFLSAQAADRSGREGTWKLGQLGPLGQLGAHAGSLIASPRRDIPELNAWIEFLRDLGKPVVWLDRGDEGLLEPLTRSPGSHSRFTHCRISESALAQTALDFLRAHGHRRIAFLRIGEPPWQTSRLEALQKEAMRQDLILHNHTVPPQAWWGPPVAPELVRLLTWVSQRTRAKVRKAWLHFIRRGPRLHHDFAIHFADSGSDSLGDARFFVAFTRAHYAGERSLDAEDFEQARILWAAMAALPSLEEQGVTALIAPNDVMARSLVLTWLGQLGLSVPGDVSVLSFDNVNREAFFPLTTVDFGFDYLGYQAFHALMGDIPVERNRQGCITARPRVMDRGSVGRVGPTS